VATADATYQFGSSGAVVARTEEFGFFNKDYIARAQALYIGNDAITWRETDGAGQSSAYGSEFDFDAEYANDAGVRGLGMAAPMSRGQSRNSYYFAPEHRGKVVGLDKKDPNIKSEGSLAEAVMMRQQASYSLCLQSIDRLIIDAIFGATTPFLAADVASGGAWSVAASNIQLQLASARNGAGVVDGELLTELAISHSHFLELKANTSLVTQYGGNTGAGTLSPELLQTALSNMGVEKLHVFRSRWGVLGNFAVLMREGTLQGRWMPQDGEDGNGISVEEEFLAGSFGNVPLEYASKHCDLFVPVDYGVRLSGV